MPEGWHKACGNREAGSETMGTELMFTDSCVPVNRKTCVVGTSLTNPCSCQSYFVCNTNFAIINQTCAGGTFFDHTKNACDTQIKVEINEICKRTEPWLQCVNETGADIGKLAQRCGGSYVTSTTVASPGGATDNGNTGLIVGVIVACVLLFIVLAILVYCWYKRQNTGSAKGMKDHKDSINNPSYFNKPERIESVYAQIDDNMNSPVYNSNTLTSTRPPLPGNRPSSSQSSTASGVISLDVNGTDRRVLDLEGAYVEPTTTGNVPKVMRTSDTLDSSTVSVYSEVLEPEPEPEPTTGDTSTPYDNSWQS
ncbi:uncharacterized protein LOC117331834 isoform X2 [Pecten maximus]|uniref:uncharacterized protein LOC117331834 isoform X2 n=1 Tax=Pecten maximus TaxID=6579 RepID=UPI00145827DC|nr:uncharacterized protein LOC117331834 isoform X2 [Pecten maximus]